jgi:type VI secretion system secreted protein Hcp
MAGNSYLKADPIKGESAADGHTDWIDISGYSFGISQPMSAPGGLIGNQSAPDFHVFSVHKEIDKSSIDLYQFCAKGTEITKMELEVCQETDKKTCYWKFEFEHVTVQSINFSGGSGRPTENITFCYTLVKYTYVPIKDGKEGTKIGPKGWDLNKKGEA